MGIARMPSTALYQDSGDQVDKLNERTKELQCLYGAFKLLNKADVPLDRMLQDVVDLMPGGWQYPEQACALILLGDKEYRSERHVASECNLTADIVVAGETLGAVEIAYTEPLPKSLRDPFLEEEVFLLEALASLVGQILRRKTLEDEKIRLYKEVQRKYEKILSGFIPICASCKNIRDEDGSWQPVETYVQKRTEAQFSHGLCPVCIQKLYPYLKG